MGSTLKLGTRGSPLALWQARHVQALIAGQLGAEVELTIIKTSGDKNTEQPLSEIGALAGGKGLFVKEIEEALLDLRVDLAVHSSKDLPSTVTAGLALAAFMEREDPRDALVVRKGVTGSGEKVLPLLPRGAKVGTSSLRRAAQLRVLRPDLSTADLRGNVDTRLRKLDEGNYDAILLAHAGLKRLGHGARISALLDPDTEMVPAVGQGALGIEVRAGEELEARLKALLDHSPTRTALEAERGFLAGIGGGCEVPVAAHAIADADGGFVLTGLIAALPAASGAVPRMVRGSVRGRAAEAALVGEDLALRLLSQGGKELLAAG